MLSLTTSLVALLVQAPAVATELTWPPHVHEVALAIESQDIGRFNHVVGQVYDVGNGAKPAEPMSTGSALAMLSGCRRIGEVPQGSVYPLDYECPSRRLQARGCDSGDLRAIVTRATTKSTLMVVRAPKHKTNCLPPIFSKEDYPKEAWESGWEGDVTVDLTVGTNGWVRDCRIATSSGYQILDEMTCYVIVARARFKPATDQDGKPIERQHRPSAVRWRL